MEVLYELDTGPKMAEGLVKQARWRLLEKEIFWLDFCIAVGSGDESFMFIYSQWSSFGCRYMLKRCAWYWGESNTLYIRV